MNRFIRCSPVPRRRLASLARVALVAAAVSASAWAQEPVPKSLSPVPEVRFFESQPTVGAPLNPAYRASPGLNAASAAQPGGPASRAKTASQPVRAAKGAVGSPLAADGSAARTPPCDSLSGETRQKCIERTSP